MSNNKLLYEAPVAETFVVRFEGKILEGSLIYGAQSGRNVDYMYDDSSMEDLGSF